MDCGNKTETSDRWLNILKPSEYKEKDEKTEIHIYLNICEYNKILTSEKLYNHQPEILIETLEASGFRN